MEDEVVKEKSVVERERCTKVKWSYIVSLN